ncbi:hypothetical protein GINT2_000248 [Glugoides intestinalis]
MLCVILFVMGILCDNIEIATKDFRELHLNEDILKPEDLVGNSVKISHLGESIYTLAELRPGIFQLHDFTLYFGASEPARIRIDVERKVYGLTTYVWIFLFFNLTLAIFASIFFSNIIHRLCINYIKAAEH